MTNPRENSRFVAQDQYFNERLKIQNERNTARNEKEFSKALNLEGRKSYFIEYYHDIKLEDQEIRQIGPFTDPRTTENFKTGYKRGMFLVEQGIVPDELSEIVKQSKHR